MAFQHKHQEFSADLCIICSKSFAEKPEEKVHVAEKGLKTLIEFSDLRQDENLKSYLEYCICNQSQVIVNVHNKCRRDYTNRRRQPKPPPQGTDCGPTSHKKIKLRSDQGDFDWICDCFFCGHDAKVDDHSDHSQIVHSAFIEFREKLLMTCDQRNDSWASEVRSRLLQVIDLPAADAVYHKSCYTSFQSGWSKRQKDSQEPRGRPADWEKMQAFNILCQWLEDEGVGDLYTLDELQLRMIDLTNNSMEVYCAKTLKQKLIAKYQDHVFFAESTGRKNIVCFRDMANYIVRESYSSEKNMTAAEQIHSIITTAAKLIKAHIFEKSYDNSLYPTKDDMSNYELGKEWVPPSLQLFLHELLKSPLKQLSIGQCIVYALRPRSVIPPIPLGLAVELEHVFASKWLLGELNQLGFSVSYDEVKRYKQSVIESNKEADAVLPAQYPGHFTQWVADNVDHNVATLDGRDTFHGMGMIAVSAPTSDMVELRARAIKRLAKMPVSDLSLDNIVPIIPYQTPKKPGLASLHFKPLIELSVPYTLPQSINMDTLWHIGWMERDAQLRPRPQWSGFMQTLYNVNHDSSALITFLPIINLNPTDESCIYSTLMFVEGQAEKQNIPTPCITFDQPLWYKAVDIIQTKSLKIVCRLGGFHMLMSFAGSIGHLMAGSGLSDCLETCYGPNAIMHMMSGHAIARALRGHFLVETALTLKLMRKVVPPSALTGQSEGTMDEAENDQDDQGTEQSSMPESSEPDVVITGTEQTDSSFEEVPSGYVNTKSYPRSETNFLLQGTDLLDYDDVTDLCKLFVDITEKKLSPNEACQNEALVKFEMILNKYKDELSATSRTSKLWLQYLSYVRVMKLFIRAERLGDWHLHLVAVGQMLNLFAATGHRNYAKSSRLYLQIMLELPNSHPWLYEMFMQHGYHAVRRSSREWAGLWSDLVIEQVLMRSLKGRGGLTHGRGMTENVYNTWILSMHECASVHQSMTTLTGQQHITHEQHTEMGVSRCQRDFNDLLKIIAWFDTYEPFNPDCTELRCLSTGITTSESDSVNCDNVEAIGHMIQSKLDGKCILETSFKKVDQVQTLVALQKGVKLGPQTVHFDNINLFSRLVVLAERTGNMQPYFDYELTAIPTSLFKDQFMRKPDKSALAKILVKDVDDADPSPNTSSYVIDGGALLHRVRWRKNVSYGEILEQYVDYVVAHYGYCSVVVFDGYVSGPTTKDHEHQRRATKSSPNINFEPSMKPAVDQQTFLANVHNKSLFISFLKLYLEESDIRVKQADNDADTLIVSTTLAFASEQEVVTVICDDTDVLVLLVHHFKSDMADVYIRSDPKRGQKVGLKLYSIRDVQVSLGIEVFPHILSIHAWSGCDTTSAIFSKGKTMTMRKILESTQAKQLLKTIGSYNVSPQLVGEAGIQLFAFMYGGSPSVSLGHHRYTCYMKMSASGKKLEPERMPPTERAAHFHSLRVHAQIIDWHSLGTVKCDPLIWGWQQVKGEYIPIMTDNEPGPQELLNLIRCNCKMSSKSPCGTSLCSCRKNGLKCVSACGDCHGVSCQNEHPVVNDESDDDNDDVDSELFGGT